MQTHEITAPLPPPRAATFPRGRDHIALPEAMTPRADRRRGAGLTLRWGFHSSPFGDALIVVHDGRLAGLGFVGPGGEAEAREDFARRWPAAKFVEDRGGFGALADQAFAAAPSQPGAPLGLTLIGSDFEVRVWQALREIPFGATTTYGAVAARLGRPQAARAVGAAIGRNPLAFVVPCHRVLGKGGALTGYRWGLARKRAMLGWEAGVAAGG